MRIKPMSRLPVLLVLSGVVVVARPRQQDMVDQHIEQGRAIPVIPGVFRITHVLNEGAAFSLFADSASPEHVRWALIGFSVVAALAVFIALLKMGERMTRTTTGLALVLGGAIGNVYDRIRYASVIDFLEVHIVHYHWPDFQRSRLGDCGWRMPVAARYHPAEEV